jgi:tetratricopeptide (TPR) repeat protein
MYALPISIFLIRSVKTYLFKLSFTNRDKTALAGVINLNRLFFISSIVLLLFYMVTLLISGGRGIMISLVAALVIFIYFKKGEDKFLWKILLIFGIPVMLLLHVSFIYSNFTSGFPSQFVLFHKYFKPAKYELRLEYFREALIGIKLSPLVGTGLDTFRYISYQYQQKPQTWSWYAHNHFLEIFQSTGIIGGILFICLIFILFKEIFRNIKSKDVRSINKVIFFILMVSLIHVQVDYDWSYISIFIWFWLSVSVLLPHKINHSEKIYYLPIRLVSSAISITIIIISISSYIYPFSITTIFTQANNYLIKGDKIQALEQLNKGYFLDGHNPQILEKIAEVYLSDKNYQKAHDWYKKAILANPLEASHLVQQDYMVYVEEIEADLVNKHIYSAYNEFVNSVKYNPFYFSETGGEECIRRINIFLTEGDKTGAINEFFTCLKKVRDIVYEKEYSVDELNYIQNQLVGNIE